MGYSILMRRAVAANAADRLRRRSELWAEAKAVRAQWRAEMLPPAIAATMLGVHRNTLARWVKADKLTGYKLGPEAQSPVRFRRADIARLKAAMSGEPVPQVADDVPEPPPGVVF
jgi:hypothetical protein